MAEVNWQPSKAEFWENLPSPARPWPSEVSWFEEYVLGKKAEGKTEVLILGATIEFRSMCHKHGVNVHVVDFSKKFYDILSEQSMEHKGEETFYEQDWRSMELGKKFDLILSDLAANVLHTNDYDIFYQRILAHLKPDGLFINRYWAFPDRKPIDLEKVANMHYQLHEGKYSFYQTSMQCIYPYKAEYPDFMWNISASQTALESLYSKGLIKKDDYNFFIRALAVEKNPGSTMVREDYEGQVKKYFKILDIHFGTDPGHEWFPIYVLSK